MTISFFLISQIVLERVDARSSPSLGYPWDGFPYEKMASSGSINNPGFHYWYRLSVSVNTQGLAPGLHVATVKFSQTGAKPELFNDVIKIRHVVLGGKTVPRTPILAKMGSVAERKFVVSNPTGSAVTFDAQLSGLWFTNAAEFVSISTPGSQQSSSCPGCNPSSSSSFPSETGAFGTRLSTSVNLEKRSSYYGGVGIAAPPCLSGPNSPPCPVNTPVPAPTATPVPYTSREYSSSGTYIKAWIEIEPAPSPGSLPQLLPGATATVKLSVLGAGVTDFSMPSYTTALALTASDSSLSFATPVDVIFSPRYPQLAGPLSSLGSRSYEVIVDPEQLYSGSIDESLNAGGSLPFFSYVDATITVLSANPPMNQQNSPWMSSDSRPMRYFSTYAPSFKVSGSLAESWNSYMYSNYRSVRFDFSREKPGRKSLSYSIATSDGYYKESTVNVYVIGAREDLPDTEALAENCVSLGPHLIWSGCACAGTELRSMGEYEFSVTANNAKGKGVKGSKFIVTYGGSSPVGARRDVCGRSESAPPCFTHTIQERGDGEYRVKFSLVPRGASFVNVLLDGVLGLEHIPGSPFVVFMYPALNSVPPRLVSAKFSRVGNQIGATFDVPTDRAGFLGPADCSRILSLGPESNNTLGAKARCSWIDAKSVLITIGAGATVMPGDSIVVLPGTVSNNMQTSDAVNSSAVIAEPETVQSPQIAIQGPAKVGSCSPFTARVGVTGTAGGLTSSGWTVNQAPQALDAILAECNLDFSAGCSFPASIAPGSYSLTFTATNRFKKTATATYTFEKLSVNIPMVTLSGISEGSTRVKTRRNVQTIIVARARVDSCDANSQAATGTVDYKWTTPVGTFTGPQIGFPRDYFSIGTFEMTLAVTAPGLPTVTMPVAVDVAAQPITLTFVGGTTQTAARGGRRVIQTQLIDPDRQSGTPTYSWTMNGASVGATGASYEFDPSAAGGSETVEVTATATLGSRSSNTAKLTLMLVPAGAPVVSVTAKTTSPLRHNRAYPLGLYGTVTTRPSSENAAVNEKSTLLWEVTEGDFGFNDATTRLTPVDGLGMLVTPFTLSPGASYRFRLTATGVSASEKLKGYSEASLTAFSPPTPGTCSVSPASGEQIKTRFTLTCSGFDTFDESKPLRYQFRTVNSNPSTIYRYADAGVIEDPAEQRRALLDSETVTAFSTDPTVSALLPAGNGVGRELALVALVSDVDGASIMYKLGLVQVVPQAFASYAETRSFLVTSAGGLTTLDALGDTASLLSTLDILSPAFESFALTGARGLRRALLQLDASVSESLGSMVAMLRSAADKLAISVGSSGASPTTSPAAASATATAPGSGERNLAPDALEQLSSVAAKVSANAALLSDADLKALTTLVSELVGSYPSAFPDPSADASAQRNLFGAIRNVLFNVTRARPASVANGVLSTATAAQRRLAALQRPAVCGATPNIHGNTIVSTVCSASAGGAGGRLTSLSGNVAVSLPPAALAAEVGSETELALSLETTAGSLSPYPTAFDGATLLSEIVTVHASAVNADGSAGRQVFSGYRGSGGGFTFTFNNVVLPGQSGTVLPGVPSMAQSSSSSSSSSANVTKTEVFMLYWSERAQKWVHDTGCGGIATRNANTSATTFNSACSHLTTFAVFAAPANSNFLYVYEADGVYVPFSAGFSRASAASAAAPSLSALAATLLALAVHAVALRLGAGAGARGARDRAPA
eukprot:tig00020965_g16853.t1